MTRVLIAIASLLAAAGIGALAASIAGGDPPPPPFRIDPDRDLGPLPIERVGDPAARQIRRGRGGRGGGQLDYFQTVEPLEVAPGTEEGATLTCPKGFKAAGGYFVTGRSGSAFLSLNAPKIAEDPEASATASNRSWAIGVYNASGESDQAKLGVVCLKKRR